MVISSFLFFSFPKGRLIFRNTESLEVNKVSSKARLFHCCHHEIEFVFIAFLFPFRKALGKSSDRLFLHPWFWFSPHCSSCLFITKIFVKFNAILVSCTCSRHWAACPPLPRVPKGDGMWPCYHPFMLQSALSGPETSSGCWQDGSMEVLSAFSSLAMGGRASASDWTLLCALVGASETGQLACP